MKVENKTDKGVLLNLSLTDKEYADLYEGTGKLSQAALTDAGLTKDEAIVIQSIWSAINEYENG